MKRVLRSLTLCMMLFLVSCSNDKYQLITFDKNDIWGIKLEMYQKTKGPITVNMQESIFYEEQADNALKLMKDDIKSIQKFNKLINDKIEVYILDKVFLITVFIQMIIKYTALMIVLKTMNIESNL